MEIIETSTFTRQIVKLLTDEEYATFQVRLAADPDEGAIIRGSGGIRKVRVLASSRGKRGEARVIYYWAVRKNVLLFLFAYAKNEAADLTPRQIVALAKGSEGGICK